MNVKYGLEKAAGEMPIAAAAGLGALSGFASGSAVKPFTRGTGLSNFVNTMQLLGSLGGAAGGALGSLATNGSAGGSFVGMGLGDLAGFLGAYALNRMDAKKKLKRDLKEEKEMYKKYKEGDSNWNEGGLPGIIPTLSKVKGSLTGAILGGLVPGALTAYFGMNGDKDAAMWSGLGTGAASVLGGVLGYHASKDDDLEDLKAQAGLNFARGKALAREGALDREGYKQDMADGPDPLLASEEEYDQYIKSKKKKNNL